MMVDLASTNLWAILLATVVGYALGALWYAPPVLGNRWMAALGKSREQLGSPLVPMTVQFLATIVVAIVLAVVVVRFGAITWIEGGAIGLALSVGLVATSMLSDWLFCRFNMSLYWIQSGYKITHITVMGAILGAWR